MEFIREGSAETVIDEQRVGGLLDSLLTQLRQRRPLRRVLLLPPDITRLHSWAGPLTCLLQERLAQDAAVAVLPATGTHTPMTEDEIARMFPTVPRSCFHAHDWRRGVVSLGEVPAALIRRVSGGHLDFAVQVEVDRLLALGNWDVILSIGQLVPHEVAGIANHSKNVFVGAGGSDFINKSHWLGAVHGIERTLGRADNPVREVLQHAAEGPGRGLPVVYLLTVRARDASGRLVTRGLFAGDDAACFRHGAELCRRVNLDVLERAPRKVVVYLDPLEYRSTWLGNKAVYRTRMAIAGGGELVVLAPGVRTFGEDPAIDLLVRTFGYRGTPATLEAVRTRPELAANLSAAAHLIHGSSEGRFAITYCPGHLEPGEIEKVGYQFGELDTMLRRYPPDRLKDGWNTLPGGEEVFYVSNPALGLWCTADRFEGRGAIG
jgi:nickel-dependent lactate racemase